MIIYQKSTIWLLYQYGVSGIKSDVWLHMKVSSVLQSEQEQSSDTPTHLLSFI